MRDQGLVRLMGGDRSCSQPCILFVGMTCSRYKRPMVYHQGIGDCAVLFCKSPLELVVVVPSCILLLLFVFCDLPFVVLHYGPFTVLSFAGSKFDILWHTMLGPIYRVLYIFYCVNLVLLIFCYRVAALIVNNNMYTCLV